MDPYTTTSNTIWITCGKPRRRPYSSIEMVVAICNTLFIYIFGSSVSTAEMRCLRKAAGKTRMDKIRNEEIRRRVNIQPAEQTANKKNIRWWSHVKTMAPMAPQSKALVIKPEGRQPRGRPQNRWEDDVPRWYKEKGIPMTDVNNWVKERRQIVYQLDADGRRVRLK